MAAQEPHPDPSEAAAEPHSEHIPSSSNGFSQIHEMSSHGPSSRPQASPDADSQTPASLQDNGNESLSASRPTQDKLRGPSEETDIAGTATELESSREQDSPASLPVPTSAQLLDAILPIRSEAPTLGVPKLLLRLKTLNPSWQLSEKRLRKFLIANPNLSPQASNQGPTRLGPRLPSEPLWVPDYAWEKDWEAASAENSSAEPASSLDDALLLECRQRSVKVEPVRFPQSNKGSGLIAKDNYPNGTVVIKEDAFVWVPPNKLRFFLSQ